MRNAIAVVVLLLAATAMANPIAIELYIDFDPPNFVPSTYPVPYEEFNAYVMAELWGAAPVESISFDLDFWDGAMLQTGPFASLDPSVQVQFEGNGITVVNPNCWDTWPVTLGYLPLMYLGGEGLVEVLPHGDHGHTFHTCGDPGETFDYCYVMHGGVGMEPSGPDELCGNPVQDVTWGSVKALYR